MKTTIYCDILSLEIARRSLEMLDLIFDWEVYARVSGGHCTVMCQ